MRLLLVDNQQPEAARLEPLLQPLAVEIARTSSVEEAIAFATNVTVDLLLLDLTRPDLDGLRTVTRVRAEPAWDALPVVLMLSPRAGAADRARALEAGADEALETPVAPTLLRARLRRLLRMRAAHVQAAARAAELAEGQRRQESLLRCIAHDLKNPIGVVHANLEFIESALPAADVDVDVAAALRDGLSAARRALALAEDVYLAARPDEARIPLDLRPVGVGRVLATLSERCAETAADRGVRLELPASPSGRLLADARLLIRALENLLEHALRHTPRGGSVRVEVALADRARFTIARSGLPPAPEDVDRLFDRYARNDGPDAGPGLGLYVARRAAEAHGGRVRIVEADGFATAFVVEVPGAFADTVEPADLTAVAS